MSLKHVLSSGPAASGLLLLPPLAGAAVLVFEAGKTSLLRAFFLFLVSLTAGTVAHVLRGPRWGVGLACALALAGLGSSLFPYRGPFELHQINWHDISQVESIRTRLHTFPGSPRWEYVRSRDFTPYLALSLSQLDADDEVALVVNGVNLGPLQDQPGIVHRAGGYLLPLAKEHLFARDFLEVLLLFSPGREHTFFTASAEDLGPLHPPQEVCSGGRCTTAQEFLGGQQLRFVVEVRIVDDQERTLGLLY